MIEKLFKDPDKQLDKDGILVHAGKLVDATIAEAPVQRNSRDENKDIKEGNIPEEWKDNESKLRQKDTDAKWVSHNETDYFGYKDHVKVDEKTPLITGYEVTSANVKDRVVLEGLMSKKENGGQPLHADSAYRSEQTEERLKGKNIESQIHEKNNRNLPLTKIQKHRNRKKLKVTARIEHIFGFMTNSMHGIYLQYRSFKRIAAGIGLMNLTCHILRLVQLNVVLSK